MTLNDSHQIKWSSSIDFNFAPVDISASLKCRKNSSITWLCSLSQLDLKSLISRVFAAGSVILNVYELFCFHCQSCPKLNSGNSSHTFDKCLTTCLNPQKNLLRFTWWMSRCQAIYQRHDRWMSNGAIPQEWFSIPFGWFFKNLISSSVKSSPRA